MFGKYILTNKAQGSASIHEEPPFINQVYDKHFISLQANFFIAGDLAFYASILGKENMGGMGGIWCPWRMLSKQQWSLDPLGNEEEWTNEKLYDI